MLRWISVLITTLALLGPTEQIPAAELFVSNVCGDDANADGERENPFASIAAAINNASAGDTIRVLPSAGAAQGCPSLLAYAHTTVSEDLCIVAVAGPGETLSEGFSVNQDIDCTIRGFTITNPSGNGITAGHNDQTANRVTVENCVIDGCAGHGISVENPRASATHRLWVKNCVVSGCDRAGITISAAATASRDEQPGVTVENSIIVGNEEEGIQLSTCDLRADWPDITIRYSYIQENNAGNEQIACEGNQRIVVTNPVNIAPTFENEDLCDFRLEPTSTIRHRGNPACLYLNPDGTRNDPGAFGGPGASGFYPQTGPIIEQVEVEPAGQPGRVRIRVVVRER